VSGSVTLEDRAKREVGYSAVDAYVRDGTCIGLGTGTTAKFAVDRVGELVAKGWSLRAVPTSVATATQCRMLGIPLANFGSEAIDVAIDGADETTRGRDLIKGGGGALFREKAVALAAATFVVIVTDRKVVAKLGAFALPVEVVPYSLPVVLRELQTYGVPITHRNRDGAAYLTDNGNAILDCAFGTIDDPGALDARLQALHGVVDTGLFVGLTARVLVAGEDGSTDAF